MTGEPAAVVERLVAAPPQDVYDQWTDPATMAQWICPEPVRLTAVKLDSRVGRSARNHLLCLAASNGISRSRADVVLELAGLFLLFG